MNKKGLMDFQCSKCKRIKREGGISIRVIAGKARGHKLTAVPGGKTRPTADRVKEAIFSMIGPYFNGGVGLDLFAGTGGLGIEALSRGMDTVIFIEQNVQALRVLKKNLNTVKLSDHAEVYHRDARKMLHKLARRRRQFDVIFLDPPYQEKPLVRFLEQIGGHSLLHPKGVVVVEHAADQALPVQADELRWDRTRNYGQSSITLFRPNE